MFEKERAGVPGHNHKESGVICSATEHHPKGSTQGLTTLFWELPMADDRDRRA
jgi:hypothetical protein